MPLLKYGQYDDLLRDRRVKKIFTTLDAVSAKTGVPYFIVGGLAVYLYVDNPPQDYPDIDILLDCDSKQAEVFIRSLEQLPQLKLFVLDVEDDNVFATLMYDRELQVDIFTSQEIRRFLTEPAIRKGLRLEPIEALIVEKLVRSTYADILMAVDLLATQLYDWPTLTEYARSYRLMPRLVFLRKIANLYAEGKISSREMKRWARRMSQ